MVLKSIYLQVLIMDKLTVKIMSYACKMADITDEGVSCKNQEGFPWKVFVFVCFAMLSAFAQSIPLSVL